MIQPYIEGEEYTVDIMCDFDGNPIFIVPRRRLEVRGGEVLKTQIFLERMISEACETIIKKLKPCGPLTVQLIRRRSDGADYYIEINPRFGGGSPMSMKAGADSAEILLRLLKNERVNRDGVTINDKVVYSRFDQSICIPEYCQLNSGIRAVIFDLDDTLYSEQDYVRSGFCALKSKLSHIPEVSQKLWKAYLNGKNAIDTVLNEAGIDNRDLKKECVEAYRNHIPEIQLYQGARELILKLREDGYQVGIITDGRVTGQKNKIKALGLDQLVSDIIITDELGGPQFRKPNEISFRIIQQRWGIPFGNIVYVGDNPDKDFTAPNQLGMQSIYFRNSEGIYRREWEGKPPLREIHNLSELYQIIYGNSAAAIPNISQNGKSAGIRQNG